MPRKTNRPRHPNPEELNSALSADESAGEEETEFDGYLPDQHGPASDDFDRYDFDGDLDNEYAEPEPGDFWLELDDDEL